MRARTSGACTPCTHSGLWRQPVHRRSRCRGRADCSPVWVRLPHSKRLQLVPRNTFACACARAAPVRLGRAGTWSWRSIWSTSSRPHRIAGSFCCRSSLAIDAYKRICKCVVLRARGVLLIIKVVDVASCYPDPGRLVFSDEYTYELRNVKCDFLSPSRTFS